MLEVLVIIKTVTLQVLISRVQVATFSGKNLGSVTLSEDGKNLVVNRKRIRSSKFDSSFYPLSKVVAFVEGDGGKDSAAYASVLTEVILRSIYGKGIVDGNFVKLVDEDGVAHSVNLLCDAVVSVTEIVADELEQPGELAGDDDEEEIRLAQRVRMRKPKDVDTHTVRDNRRPARDRPVRDNRRLQEAQPSKRILDF
jgi:hypothetical protein